MHMLLWSTLISFLVYHGAMTPSAIKGHFPSLDSYLYGLLVFMGPFLALILAALCGLPRQSLKNRSSVGMLVIAMVAVLIAKDDAYFGVASILIIFGCFTGLVLLGTLGKRAIKGGHYLLRVVLNKVGTTKDGQ